MTSGTWARCRHILNCWIGSLSGFRKMASLQEVTPAHSDQRHLPAEFRQQPGILQARCGKSLSLADEPRAPGRGKHKRCNAFCHWQTRFENGWSRHPTISISKTIIRPSMITHSSTWTVPASCRRSIYRFVVRSVPDPLMDSVGLSELFHLNPQTQRDHDLFAGARGFGMIHSC